MKIKILQNVGSLHVGDVVDATIRPDQQEACAYSADGCTWVLYSTGVDGGQFEILPKEDMCADCDVKVERDRLLEYKMQSQQEKYLPGRIVMDPAISARDTLVSLIGGKPTGIIIKF